MLSHSNFKRGFMSWKLKLTAFLSVCFVSLLSMCNHSARKNDGPHLAKRSQEENEAATVANSKRMEDWNAANKLSPSTTEPTVNRAIKLHKWVANSEIKSDDNSSPTEVSSRLIQEKLADSGETSSESKLLGSDNEKSKRNEKISNSQTAAFPNLADIKENKAQQVPIKTDFERPSPDLTNIDPNRQGQLARNIASIPQFELSHQICDLEEFRRGRLAESEVSDDEWNCALTKVHNYTYVVRPGESMSSISVKEFGTYDYWPKIWSLNPDIENPHDLKVGKKLKFSDSK